MIYSQWRGCHGELEHLQSPIRVITKYMAWLKGCTTNCMRSEGHVKYIHDWGHYLNECMAAERIARLNKGVAEVRSCPQPKLCMATLVGLSTKVAHGIGRTRVQLRRPGALAKQKCGLRSAHGLARSHGWCWLSKGTAECTHCFGQKRALLRDCAWLWLKSCMVTSV